MLSGSYPLVHKHLNMHILLQLHLRSKQGIHVMVGSLSISGNHPRYTCVATIMPSPLILQKCAATLQGQLSNV